MIVATLSPSSLSTQYVLELDLSKINPKPLLIGFDNTLTGTVVYNDVVLNGNQVMAYTWNSNRPLYLEMTLTVPTLLEQETVVMIDVNLNDAQSISTTQYYTIALTYNSSSLELT